MNILNNIQYREYNRAKALIRFFGEAKSVYSSFTPFANEVTRFLNNAEQISAQVAIKQENGKGATTEKKELKKAIAREGAYLCKLTMAYALEKGDYTLQNAVRYTYTDIFAATDGNAFFTVKSIVKTITPLLEDEEFRRYGIMPARLVSITEKAKEFNSYLGKAACLNNLSDFASRTITTLLKKIKGNIAQLARLVPFFEATHPQFVTGFNEACIVHNTGVCCNAMEGSITEEGTGMPVEGVSIMVEGKHKKAVSNMWGYYRITGIKTGTCMLTITAEGYKTAVLKVKIIRGKTVELNTNLIAERVNGSAEKAA